MRHPSPAPARLRGAVSGNAYLSSVTACRASTPPPWVAASSPAPGTAALTRAHAVGRHLRLVVRETAGHLEGQISAGCLAADFGPRAERLGAAVPREALAFRAAWCQVATWLLGYATGHLASDSGIEEALEWFSG